MSDVPGRLLRETLQAGMRGESSGCLDAETVARWADNTLSRKDRAAVEAHASGCARCQSMLAAMARTAPPAVSRSWLRSPIVAWVAPLTVVAAALLVYVQMAPRSRSAAPAASAAQTNLAREMDSRAAGRSASLSGERQTDRDRLAEPTEVDKTVAGEARAKDAREPRGAAAAKGFASEQPRAQARATAAAAKATAPTPAAADREKHPPIAAPTAVAELAAPAATAPAPPPPPPSPAAPPASVAGGIASRDESPARANAAQALALESRRPPSALVIRSSTTTTRWRVILNGIVQRSTDSGTTWDDTQSTGSAIVATAGASPSPPVCWLVGPQGLVLLSTDGHTWKRIAFPESIDLTSVSAVDDKSATVTTWNGRTFKTADGGATWTR